MILFHGYGTAEKTQHRQRETWQALEKIEPELRKRGWIILHQPLGKTLGADGLSDYERSILELWGTDDLVVLEHDLVPTLDMLIGLEPDEHDICAQAYNLYLDGDQLAAVDQAYTMMQQLDERGKEIAEAHGLCAQAYYLWHAAYKPDIHAANRYLPTIAHRVVVEEPNKHRWAHEGEEWADYYGLGLTRFSKAFMRSVKPDWERGPWDNLDTRMSKYTHNLGIKAHIHGPNCVHNHVGGDPVL